MSDVRQAMPRQQHLAAKRTEEIIDGGRADEANAQATAKVRLDRVAHIVMFLGLCVYLCAVECSARLFLKVGRYT